MTSKIVRFDPQYKQAFYDITMRWLAKDFTVEPQHAEMLTHPEEVLLKSGGEVFFAVESGRAVGTVGLKNHGDGIYELTKLGVDDAAKGGGHGRRLCEAVIADFLAKNGKRLFLESHTMLKPALALYKSLGFVVGSNPAGETYECTNCYMEWQDPAATPIVARAESDKDILAVKEVFQEFVAFLPINLDFQGIDKEMERFPDGYEFLLLAKHRNQSVGAVALKRHNDDVCEMKRLYVRPAAQGSGAGRLLCERLISEARAAGYKTMLLDSLRRLEAAVQLYEKLGFKEIAPYNYNPEDDVVYMSLTL